MQVSFPLSSDGNEPEKNMTKEEMHLRYDLLWEYPVRFQRQKVLNRYIVDCYCAAAKIVIELDGSQYYETQSQVLRPGKGRHYGAMYHT